jgi:hypothetical protein
LLVVLELTLYHCWFMVLTYSDSTTDMIGGPTTTG